jgi:hypothetical protein
LMFDPAAGAVTCSVAPDPITAFTPSEKLVPLNNRRDSSVSNIFSP